MKTYSRSTRPLPSWKKIVPFRKQIRAAASRISDILFFPLWLLWQRLRHGKKLVIVCRCGALGDVVCTLPVCGEIRKRHPECRLVFLTGRDYKKIVLLSRAADEVFGAKSWTWPFVLPDFYLGPGIVEAIYNPRTNDERVPNAGAQIHLIDDLAASCGITIPAAGRQPRLFPPSDLIKSVQAAYAMAEDAAQGRLIIGINCGRTWPVRMWDAANWQALVDRIHAEFDAVILQFGLTNGSGDEFENLRGVRLLSNHLKSDELIGLIASCHLVVSIDSGPIHVAGSVGTPVVGLYGAVNPRHRLPPDSLAIGLFGNVPCLFCHHTNPKGHWETNCPHEIRCMKALDAEIVFQAVKGVLRQARGGR